MKAYGIQIRKATIDDIDEIHDIEKKSHGRWKKKFFYNELSTSFSIFLVAVKGTEVVGFSIAWNITEEIQLNNISVKNEYRRQGIGSLLLNYIVDLLKENHPRLINLEVNSNNSEARKFYERYGFHEAGVRKNYYDDEDALLMIKEL